MANSILFINEYFGLDISIDLFHGCSPCYCSSFWHSISNILIELIKFIFVCFEGKSMAFISLVNYDDFYVNC